MYTLVHLFHLHKIHKLAHNINHIQVLDIIIKHDNSFLLLLCSITEYILLLSSQNIVLMSSFYVCNAHGVMLYDNIRSYTK